MHAYASYDKHLINQRAREVPSQVRKPQATMHTIKWHRKDETP